MAFPRVSNQPQLRLILPTSFHKVAGGKPWACTVLLLPWAAPSDRLSGATLPKITALILCSIVHRRSHCYPFSSSYAWEKRWPTNTRFPGVCFGLIEVKSSNGVPSQRALLPCCPI